MWRYKVRSKYEKYNSKHYLREIISKATGEVVYYLYFDTKPSWNEIVKEVQRLDNLET